MSITESGLIASNSSTTPLGASAAFVGTSVDVSLVQFVTVAIKADQAGSLFLEQGNGAAAFQISQSYDIVAGVAQEIVLTTAMQYFRCRLVNGPVAQTILALQARAYVATAALTAATASVQIYGTDGALRAIATDASGNIALDSASANVSIFGSNGAVIATDASDRLTLDASTSSVEIVGSNGAVISTDATDHIQLVATSAAVSICGSNGGTLVSDATDHLELIATSASVSACGSNGGTLVSDASDRLVIDQSSSSALAYGYDGAANQKLSVHTDGALKVKSIADTVVVSETASATNNATSAYRNLALGVAGVAAKASAGRLYQITAYNTTANVAYVKVYQSFVAATPAETDTPILTLGVAATSTLVWSPAVGLYCTSSGIGFRCTTGIADNDVGAPASAVVVNAIYA